MSEKRRDNKGRLLRTNEFQRPDGRYEYRYLDNGIKRNCYSWRLVESDKNPTGKRTCKALRTLEKEVADQLAQAKSIANPDLRHTTFNDYFDNYLIKRKKLKPMTQYALTGRYNKHIREAIGSRKVAEFKAQDVEEFVNSIIETSGLKASSIKQLCSILSLIFKKAMNDGVVNQNPISDILEDTLPETVYDHRQALTRQQQDAFLKYCRQHKRYNHVLPLILFILGTGCRIGEALALCWSDCDFQSGIVHINKTLGYYKLQSEDNPAYHIRPPKTKQSIRSIPMMSFVREALQSQKMIDEQVRLSKPAQVDGYSDFVFLSRNGTHTNACTVDQTLSGMIERFNNDEILTAYRERREPCLLPKISAHSLRHTFCTRLSEGTSNVKLIQTLMGHSSIQTTFDVYVDINSRMVSDQLAKVEGDMGIG